MTPSNATGPRQSTPDPSRKTRRPNRWLAGPAVGVIALVMAGSVSSGIAEPIATGKVQISAVTSSAHVALPPPGETPKLPSFADIIEHVSPAVVTVQVERQEEPRLSAFPGGARDPFGDLFRRFGVEAQPFGRGARPNNRFDDQPDTFRSRAAGAGFIIDPDGYIVTNNHVIDKARKISVTLADKREFEAKLIGADPDTDVALLKVEAKNLPTVAFGDDQRVRVGDWVVAVGNPFGLGGTVTAGIVSSIGRDIGSGPYTDYIQIDAPINRGNSGGPTFDVTGRVVGMNTAIFSPSGGSVGIGFAVPASTIQRVVDQLRTQGSVSRGWLGVEIQNLTPDLASSVGAPGAKGALVANVTPASPAARAGFRQGDVILAVNGRTLEDTRDLSRSVANLKVGERASFTVLRDGTRQNLSATIEKRDSARLAGNGTQPGSGAKDSSLGLTLMPLNPAIRQQFELDDKVAGVVVTAVEPMSDAADKGLSPGDVITRAGGRAVRAPSDIADAVEEAKRMGRETILLLVADNRGEHFVALKFHKG